MAERGNMKMGVLFEHLLDAAEYTTEFGQACFRSTPLTDAVRQAVEPERINGLVSSLVDYLESNGIVQQATLQVPVALLAAHWMRYGRLE